MRISEAKLRKLHEQTIPLAQESEERSAYTESHIEELQALVEDMREVSISRTV